MWSHISITFSTQDVNLVLFPHTDAMVLTVHTDKWEVSGILVDNGNQAEILFLLAFKKMGYGEKQLKEPMKPLYRFRGKRIEPVRIIMSHPEIPILECELFSLINLNFQKDFI
jgi:hypothetical protein